VARGYRGGVINFLTGSSKIVASAHAQCKWAYDHCAKYNQKISGHNFLSLQEVRVDELVVESEVDLTLSVGAREKRQNNTCQWNPNTEVCSFYSKSRSLDRMTE